MVKRFGSLAEILELLSVSYIPEYKFHHKRKFRLDYYLPDYQIGLEYEGIYSNKSRHRTISGYRRDIEKYNLVALEGIMLLRFASDHLASGEARKIIEDAISLKTSNSNGDESSGRSG